MNVNVANEMLDLDAFGTYPLGFDVECESASQMVICLTPGTSYNHSTGVSGPRASSRHSDLFVIATFAAV